MDVKFGAKSHPERHPVVTKQKQDLRTIFLVVPVATSPAFKDLQFGQGHYLLQVLLAGGEALQYAARLP